MGTVRGMSDTIRVVLYPQGNLWVAQALEYDIGTQGKTITAAVKRMLDTITETYRITLSEFGKPFEGIDPAPTRFHDMFDEAEDDFDFDISPREQDSRPIPHMTARLLEDCAAA